MAGLMKMMMDSNFAPSWFYLDRQKGIGNDAILEKIQLELHNHAVNSGYNLDLWTDKFVKEVATMYFNHFDKLYAITSNQSVDSMATA